MSEISGAPVTDPNPAPGSDPAPTPSLTDPNPNPNPPAPNPNPAPASDPAAAPAPAAPSPWGEDLDDEVKAFVGEKTPSQVAKELFGAQKLIGKKAIGIPGKDSTPEEQRAFHEARGVPQDPAGYQFDDVREEIQGLMPEGMEWDEGREKQFRDWARKSNLSNGEAKEFLRNYLSSELEGQREGIKAAAEATKQAKTLLTENWGAEAEQKSAMANRFMRHMGLTDQELDVFMAVASKSPQARFNLVNFFAEQGALLQEGSAPGSIPSSQSMTPEQAREAKEAYLARGDNHTAYMESSHPRHREVSEQMAKYGKIERGIQ